eukprot:TRINITY_DN13272_c0_g1_i1.p1 TRINITY_DN13272_c0_g1~~TRINITY_DN13272_c0_g1_i1.p1  ORF type:complete len:246 (-),score=51.26 TRINITY_DN13272_c0_g1_i1:38-733(-)
MDGSFALETNRIAAKLAYAQKKYDEAWTSTKFLVVNTQTALSADEITLLANVVDVTLPSLVEELGTTGTGTQEVEDLVQANLELDLLSLADTLLPNLTRQLDLQEKKPLAILQRVIGDFYAVVACYHSNEDVRRNARKLALNYYHTCVLKCGQWTEGEPQQIRAAVNYATFCEDVLLEHDQALTLLTMAFNRILGYKAANDQEQQASTVLLKEIRTKLVAWFPDDEAQPQK